MSFNYENSYLLLWKEMKKRESESNNPYTLIRFFDNSNPNSLIKLHEALLLVKSHNLVAKEEYLIKLQSMLYQTMRNKTDIDVIIKICRLIGKYPHLASINEHLKLTIQQVIQLNDRNRHVRAQENASEDNFNQMSNAIIFTPLTELNALTWFDTQEPTGPAPIYCFSQIDWNSIDWTGLSGSSKSHVELTVVGQHMSRAIMKWLDYIKLHKYHWFFNSLSYHEIECIDEDNIVKFLERANKNYITKGAQKKICIKTKTLRERPNKLKYLLLALDLEVNPIELCDHVTYMLDILHYPIPNQHCTVGYGLQQNIVLVMEKLLSHTLEKLDTVKYYVSDTLLGTSINKYLQCTLLITGSADFTKYQIDTIFMFAQALKNKVHQFPTNCF